MPKPVIVSAARITAQDCGAPAPFRVRPPLSVHSKCGDATGHGRFRVGALVISADDGALRAIVEDFRELA